MRGFFLLAGAVALGSSGMIINADAEAALNTNTDGRYTKRIFFDSALINPGYNIVETELEDPEPGGDGP